jgi:hypothetical protein
LEDWAERSLDVRRDVLSFRGHMPFEHLKICASFQRTDG